MARSRFVLRYRGEGRQPEADVARIRDLAGTRIVDASARMLLVESEATPLQELLNTLPDWVMAPERQYEVPDTRKKIERPPG